MRLQRDLDKSKIIYKLSIMTTGVYDTCPTENYDKILNQFHNLNLCNKLSFCDESLGPQPDFKNHFAIRKDMAECAVSLWNITKQWPEVNKIFS